MLTKMEFKIKDRVVYPSHGLGEIINIESQNIGGSIIQVYVISFPQDKMILKVPVSRAIASGLRAVVNKIDLEKIYNILQTKPKSGNRMWSRRAQEYENKINSGNVLLISEVVRDLYKNIDTDRSYSERTLFESALNRLASEVAILETLPHLEAVNKVIEILKEKVAA